VSFEATGIRFSSTRWVALVFRWQPLEHFEQLDWAGSIFDGHKSPFQNPNDDRNAKTPHANTIKKAMID
jgi:hypothetical protein